MSSSAEVRSLSGSCLCGGVGLSLAGARPDVDICHCSMCRRWTGMFFAGLSADSFEVEGRENVVAFRSSQWAERAFCRQCGTGLWSRFLPADHYSFLAGLFDLPAGFAIEQQIFVEQKPDWYDLAQESQMKTGAQVIEEARSAGFDV
jgi:hypothetical protein